MTTLNQTILDAARDEVAKKYGWKNWSEIIVHDLNNEAALLAMDRQAEFYRYISRKKWGMLASGEWWNRAKQREATELELYETFTTQQ